MGRKERGQPLCAKEARVVGGHHRKRIAAVVVAVERPKPLGQVEPDVPVRFPVQEGCDLVGALSQRFLMEGASSHVDPPEQCKRQYHRRSEHCHHMQRDQPTPDGAEPHVQCAGPAIM